VRRLANLARFLADGVLAFFMSLAVLKVVDLSHLSKRSRFFYRLFFERILASPQPETVTAAFARTAAVVRPLPPCMYRRATAVLTDAHTPIRLQEAPPVEILSEISSKIRHFLTLVC
jgi:hypothetical protein